MKFWRSDKYKDHHIFYNKNKSWRHIFKNVSSKVIQGHLRSKIEKSEIGPDF